MDIFSVKIFILFVIFFESYLSALLPIKVLNTCFHENYVMDKALDYLNCFVGGVFLSTTFLHILPDIRGGVITVTNQAQLKSDFPISEFLIVFFFLASLTIEYIIANFKERINNQKDIHVNCTSDVENQNSENQSGRLGKPHHKEITPLVLEESKESTLGIRRFYLLTAVYVHGLVEGIVLGLTSNFGEFWSLLLAIVLHKTIIMLSLSLNLKKQKQSMTKELAIIFVISSSTPMGIAGGIFYMYQKKSLTTTFMLTKVLLQAAAAGSFMHLTVFEILLNELKNSNLLQLFSLILGFSLVSMIALL